MTARTITRTPLVPTPEQLIATASLDSLLDAIIVLTHRIAESTSVSHREVLRAQRDLARAEITRRVDAR